MQKEGQSKSGALYKAVQQQWSLITKALAWERKAKVALVMAPERVCPFLRRRSSSVPNHPSLGGKVKLEPLPIIYFIMTTSFCSPLQSLSSSALSQLHYSKAGRLLGRWLNASVATVEQHGATASVLVSYPWEEGDQSPPIPLPPTPGLTARTRFSTFPFLLRRFAYSYMRSQTQKDDWGSESGRGEVGRGLETKV